jgi:hypothetical protein
VSTVGAGRSGNWLVRTAAAIGDLSNPFYREERQRDVWNEASAVALQVLVWLGLMAACAAAWFVGADAVPYIYALLVMIGVAGWVALLYSWSLGVHVETSNASGRRMIPLLALAVLLAAGLLRATVSGNSFGDWSTVAGAITGAAVVLGLLAAASWYARRRTRAGEQD